MSNRIMKKTYYNSHMREERKDKLGHQGNIKGSGNAL